MVREIADQQSDKAVYCRLGTMFSAMLFSIQTKSYQTSCCTWNRGRVVVKLPTVLKLLINVNGPIENAIGPSSLGLLVMLSGSSERTLTERH
jgi:hypothetical protein